MAVIKNDTPVIDDDRPYNVNYTHVIKDYTHVIQDYMTVIKNYMHVIKDYKPHNVNYRTVIEDYTRVIKDYVRVVDDYRRVVGVDSRDILDLRAVGFICCFVVVRLVIQFAADECEVSFM
jgi:hypothetical protein